MWRLANSQHTRKPVRFNVVYAVVRETSRLEPVIGLGTDPGRILHDPRRGASCAGDVQSRPNPRQELDGEGLEVDVADALEILDPAVMRSGAMR